MPEKILSTDPPDIDQEDFEDYIATDELFVDYFNTFLGLPSFPEPLRFNSDSGGFEVLTSAKHEIAQQIKLAARNKKISELTRKEWLAEHARNILKKREINEEDEIKTNFIVKCLDKEQGIQWIKEERLPLFLKSELYMEYRLAKLLSQVETSPAGMKLSIDADFRPWFKTRIKPDAPVPVDETEELIHKMFVTVGNTQRPHIETWAKTTKKAEVESVTVTTSCPLSSTSARTGAWMDMHNAVRPDSVRGSRNKNIGESDGILGEEFESQSARHSAKKVTVIAPTEIHFTKQERENSAVVPISSDDAACVMKNSTSNVAKIEAYSDSDSDQGMGSEWELSQNGSESGQEMNMPDSQRKEYTLELKSMEDYASVFVALAMKNSIVSLGSKVEDLDEVDVFKDLIPQPQGWKLGLRDVKAPLPISKLNENVFAEAIIEQERRILMETGRSSKRSYRHKVSKVSRSHTDDGKDLLDLLPGNDGISTTAKTDTIGFDEISSLSGSSEQDSVFSEQSDELYGTTQRRDRIYDFVDVKGFSKFMHFVKGTIGENFVQLWLDIDKIRFALTTEIKNRLLYRMRSTYLSVNSMKKITKEILAKWNLESASKWKIPTLLSVQRTIVEAILLYWAPQFLIRESYKLSPIYKSQEPLLSKRFDKLHRPISSQSYPTPKTITIRPLRPKSCLPRLKMKQTPKSESTTEEPSAYLDSHIMPPFHQLKFHPKYQHQMFHQLKFKPKPLSDNMLKAIARNEEAVMQKSNHQRPVSKYLAGLLNKGKRAASAGPLTQGNIAIFQSKKNRMSSAITTARSLPATLNASKRKAISESSETSFVSNTSHGSRFTIRGSDAMESMLQALYYDTKAGWYFTLYCERSGKSSWKNAVHFWFEVQEYHRKFYCKVFNEFEVKRSAKVIFARYIVHGCAENIGVTKKMSSDIHKALDPSFDELFDPAEEYVLKLLIIPWNEMMEADQDNYNKVELIEHQRSLQIGSKYSGVLKPKEEVKKMIKKTETEFEASEKYEEDLWEKVPEEYRGFTFDELVRNRIELEHFRKFLEENYAKTDILCWLDTQAFMRLPHAANEKRDEKAKEIKSKYLHKKYFFGPSSPATKEQQNLVVKAAGGWGMTLKDRPPTEMITEAQKYVRQRLENRWLPRFLATSNFQIRQRPHSQMAEVAEDVVLQRRKKRGEPWKHLDNKWQSSSDEIREFRKALLNKVTASQFRRYVSLKGDLLENDVLFWTEVQKYKDFCHIHNEPAAVEVKVTAIINCFINSQIPPTVQIDIPFETAEKILEKRKELGPYVFREAQLTVFRVLFPYWSDFCKFRENLSDEKLSTTLQRKAQRRMLQVKKQLNQQHLEELEKQQQAREEEEEAAPPPEITSQRDSDDVSVVSVHAARNMMQWSYGKYVEGLDKERMLLMMENEVKGRIPPEPLPVQDPDVTSDESDNLASDDEASSTSSASYTGKRKKKKKKKNEKIIVSTVHRTSNQSEDSQSIEKEIANSKKSTKHAKSKERQNNKTENSAQNEGKVLPTVTID